MRPVVWLLSLLAVGCTGHFASRQQAATTQKDKVVFRDDFSKGMGNWWVEGGQKIWVEDGRLHVKADPTEKGQPGNVCTVWCRQELPGNVRVAFDAHVLTSAIEANNINFFLCTSDPAGTPLVDTRASRADGRYRKYHDLNGYIFTFLADRDAKAGLYPDGSKKARFRMRRCPGFTLIDEAFDYHCRAGVTYHVVITKQGGALTYAVDGKTYMKATDPNPLTGGLLGLRTFRTYLWWDNIQVTALD